MLCICFFTRYIKRLHNHPKRKPSQPCVYYTMGAPVVRAVPLSARPHLSGVKICCHDFVAFQCSCRTHVRPVLPLQCDHCTKVGSSRLRIATYLVHNCKDNVGFISIHCARFFPILYAFLWLVYAEKRRLCSLLCSFSVVMFALTLHFYCSLCQKRLFCSMLCSCFLLFCLLFTLW